MKKINDFIWKLNCVFNRYIFRTLLSNKSIPINVIGGVMVSLLASSSVDRGFEPGRVKPKTIKLIFVASPLSAQH